MTASWVATFPPIVRITTNLGEAQAWGVATSRATADALASNVLPIVCSIQAKETAPPREIAATPHGEPVEVEPQRRNRPFNLPPEGEDGYPAQRVLAISQHTPLPLTRPRR